MASVRRANRVASTLSLGARIRSRMLLSMLIVYFLQFTHPGQSLCSGTVIFPVPLHVEHVCPRTFPEPSHVLHSYFTFTTMIPVPSHIAITSFRDPSTADHYSYELFGYRCIVFLFLSFKPSLYTGLCLWESVSLQRMKMADVPFRLMMPALFRSL